MNTQFNYTAYTSCIYKFSRKWNLFILSFLSDPLLYALLKITPSRGGGGAMALHIHIYIFLFYTCNTYIQECIYNIGKQVNDCQFC